MSSFYEQAQSTWGKTEKKTAGARHAPLPSGPQPATDPLEPDGSDPWDSVRSLAQKAAATSGIERELAAVFGSRITLARRLADAYRRKDSQMAAESAQAWIKTEVALAQLFERYEGHVQQRNDFLRAASEKPG